MQTNSQTLSSPLSPQAAAQELLNRREARKSLLAFTKYVSLEPEPALHQVKLIESLQDVIDGKVDRLMVFMPPGSAKSTYGTVLAPAFTLGAKHGRKCITASYGQRLAESFGRRVRNLTETPEYKNIFPEAGLATDSKAKGEWELNNGSSFFACGVGTGVTGRRGHMAIIDDPVKSRKEADSEVYRESVWQWYLGDLTTRLLPDAAIVIIQTRWHEDDLSGRILPKDWDGESGDILCKDGETWRVLCFHAEARENDILGRQPGEWLWPEYYTPEWWEKTKAKQLAGMPRNWYSLYQQTPTPDEGTYFKREWFWRYDIGDVPAHARTYQTADFAVTDADDGNDPDFTEIGLHAIATDDDGMPRLYLAKDSVAMQNAPERWMPEYFSMVKRHRPMCEFAEVGVIRRAIEGQLERYRRSTQSIGRIEWVSHIGDKTANARALQNMAAMGQVGLPNTEKGERLLEQLLKFPAGSHDDGVDMLAMMARVVDEAHPGFLAAPKPAEPVDRWDKVFAEDDEEESWRV